MLSAKAIFWSQLGDDKELRLRLICFYLCLSWELYLDQAEVSDQIEQLLVGAQLSAYQRWVVELYREDRTSLEEGRAAFARLKAAVRRCHNGKKAREFLFSIIPDNKQAAAVKHPLMGDLVGHRAGPTHLFSVRRARITSRKASVDSLPVVEREAEFDDFLRKPGFLESFELFWRQPPKNRDNKRTRVLILAAAIVALITPLTDEADMDREIGLLQRKCHFSVETGEAIIRICHHLSPEFLDPDWVAQSFIADAEPADRDSYETLVQTAADNENLPTNYRMLARQLLEAFKLARF
ncbi:hypothetical protein [Cerasicoccus fimbriatus]|uniref:hypothetical protein n=1 Tax=Cerasicoccus fimbriatus TaxID=3014554 RepID=UPI0022B56251|nr:hypothetical protein [Cerasicoccus sp. TK19100]